MVFRIEPLHITRELILGNVSEETLMEHYAGAPVKKGLFVSKIRQDNRPTCAYFRSNKSGRLLYKDFGAFMHYMDLLNEQGVALPTLYQEAICFVCGVAQQTPAALDRYAIAPEVRNRFLQFLQQMKTQPAAALRQSFGDTYYYYAQYISAPKQE